MLMHFKYKPFTNWKGRSECERIGLVIINSEIGDEIAKGR